MFRNLQVQGVLLVLIGVICFSTKAVFIKLAYAFDVSSTSLLFLRLLFALPFYIIIYYIERSRNDRISKKTFLQAGLLGFLGYYIASWLDFNGLAYINATMERLILFIYPTFVVLISAFILKKRISKPQLIALELSYLGIAIIMLFRSDNGQTSQDFFLGATMIVLSSMIYAIYLVGSGEIMKKIGSVRFTSIAMMFSTLGASIHKISTSGIDIMHYQTEVYYYAIIMAVIATLIPSFLISYGIKVIGASNTSIVGAVGPVSTIILAYFFLGENINIIQLIGTILVMLGVIIISIQKNKT